MLCCTSPCPECHPPDTPVTFQSHSSPVSDINRYFVILCSHRAFRNCYLEVISRNLLMTFPNNIHRKRNEQIPSWLGMKPGSVQPPGKAVTCSIPALQIRAKKPWLKFVVLLNSTEFTGQNLQLSPPHYCPRKNHK